MRQPVGGKVAEGAIGEQAFGQDVGRNALVGDGIACLLRGGRDFSGMRGEWAQLPFDAPAEFPF
jgi:hypothetical protein